VSILLADGYGSQLVHCWLCVYGHITYSTVQLSCTVPLSLQ